MGTNERRKREKIQRQNDILEAAEEVFFAKGVRNATMDDIAEKAELSKGTLYLYFKSKELLYFGIHLRGMQILREKFQEAVDSQTDGFSRVKAIGEAYIKFAYDFPSYFRAMDFYENVDDELWKELASDPLAQQCHEAAMSIFNTLVDAIKNGIKDGSIRDELDPERTAILLWSQSNGIIQFMKMRGKHFEDFHQIAIENLYEDYLDFTSLALKPKSE